jgi:hypothetical protein
LFFKPTTLENGEKKIGVDFGIFIYVMIFQTKNVGFLDFLKIFDLLQKKIPGAKFVSFCQNFYVASFSQPVRSSLMI